MSYINARDMYHNNNVINKIWKNDNVIYQRVYIPDHLDIEPLSINISNQRTANITVNATKPYTVEPEVIIYPGTSEYGVSVNYTINGNTITFTPAFNYTGTTGMDTYADIVMGDITQRLSIRINPPYTFVTDIYTNAASFDILQNINTNIIPDVDMVCAIEFEPILTGCDRFMGFSWEDMTGSGDDVKDYRVFTYMGYPIIHFDWNNSRTSVNAPTGNTDIYRVIFGNNTAGWGVICGRKNDDTWNFNTVTSTKPASLTTTNQPVRIDLSAIKVRKATIWKKINNVDTNLFNGVPVINGNGIAGLYDDVSGNFFTNGDYTILYDE